jgi:hypothetical protein
MVAQIKLHPDPHDVSAIDTEAGPQTDNYPLECVLEDSLIHEVGLVEKQGAGVQIAMSRRITVRDCSIYDTSRAGINIGDGSWGGHLIERCDVFNTVQETSDHGSFNSWGRDRFWLPKSGTPQVIKEVRKNPVLPFLDAMETTVIRDNRWRCDHGWDVDLDDGSSNYRIVNNLMLNRGLKLREGYRRVVLNNIMVNNTLHPHVWYPDSQDVFKRNIVMQAYRPIWMEDNWDAEIDYNWFTTSNADRVKFIQYGADGKTVEWSGVTLSEPKGDALSAYGASFEAGGVAIDALKPDSPLATGDGLQRGDLIQAVSGQSVSTIADLKRALKAAHNETLDVTVLRNQRPVRVKLQGWSIRSSPPSPALF